MIKNTKTLSNCGLIQIIIIIITKMIIDVISFNLFFNYILSIIFQLFYFLKDYFSMVLRWHKISKMNDKFLIKLYTKYSLKSFLFLINVYLFKIFFHIILIHTLANNFTNITFSAKSKANCNKIYFKDFFKMNI